MTGPEHWSEAAQILTDDPCEYGCPHAGCQHELRMIARAQVHATLALAAATAFGGITLTLPQDSNLAAEWNRAIGVIQ
jgi:hypothetical protein